MQTCLTKLQAERLNLQSWFKVNAHDKLWSVVTSSCVIFSIASISTFSASSLELESATTMASASVHMHTNAAIACESVVTFEFMLFLHLI